MPTATITVAGTDAPTKVGGRGRIKSETGMLFQATEDLIKAVSLGSAYDIQYNDKEYTTPEGKLLKFRVIDSVKPATGIPVNNQPQTYAAPQRTYVPASAPPSKDEDIATLAIAKEQLNKITPGDVEQGFHVLKASAMMWRKFKSWQKLGPQTAAEEMDDVIPYP